MGEMLHKLNNKIILFSANACLGYYSYICLPVQRMGVAATLWVKGEMPVI
jgi:hypothetical protein